MLGFAILLHSVIDAANPRNNLAHCFCCKTNFNNLDLLIELGHDFPAAVRLLEQWLGQYQANRPK